MNVKQYRIWIRHGQGGFDIMYVYMNICMYAAAKTGNLATN